MPSLLTGRSPADIIKIMHVITEEGAPKSPIQPTNPPHWRAAFHLHTVYSGDGRVTLPELRRRALREKVDVLFITDHNTMAGAERFQQLYRTPKVVIGNEIATQEGDLIALFLKANVPSHLPLEETLTLISQQGGVVILPHPCDAQRPSSLTEAARTLLSQRCGEVAAVEVFNGRTRGHAADRQASAWATRNEWPCIWGSDAHFPPEMAQCLFDLPAFDGPAQFRESIKQARPLRLRKTNVFQRTIFRANSWWGSYGPLRRPEEIILKLQRALFQRIGGHFCSLREVDGKLDQLADLVREGAWQPDAVLGVLGGGAYPGRGMANRLGCPFFTMRVGYPQLRLGRMDTDDLIGSRLLRMALRGDTPRIITPAAIPPGIRRILVVDDDCTSGRSLKLALADTQQKGLESRAATLRILAGAKFRPDYCAEDLSGALLRHPRFPWIKYAPDYPLFWAWQQSVTGGDWGA